MNGIRLNTVEYLYLLWLLPLLVGLFLYAWQRRRIHLHRFIDPGLLARIPMSVSPLRRGWKAALILIALAFLVLALTRPAWNRTDLVVKRSGRDVVFMLDVSRSMLAEDLSPNRLQHAKLAILDTVDRLGGDRVALVAFAGRAVVKCPLTLDYGFFRMMLEDVDLDAVSRGGTMIGDGIRTVLDQVFDDQAGKYKDIILITDGEDHESFPVEAASMAGEQGVRMIIIGLGDEKQGQRIPIYDQKGRKTFLKFQGQEVWTKLDADTLRQMSKATPGGRYLPVATGTINLGQVYMDLVASAEKKQLESKTIRQYEEKFQIFLALAFMLLCLEMVVVERKKESLS